ncbi:MAG: DUF433 domain-containing protein [Trueperaceae bacterium]
MWQTWITSNPSVLAGKPIVRYTRLSVSFLLGLLAQGWTEAQILENYPQLTREGLRAAIAYAQETVEEEVMLEISR